MFHGDSGGFSFHSMVESMEWKEVIAMSFEDTLQ